jgi:hypothetical protein
MKIEKQVKKGIVIKSDNDVILFAGSKLKLSDEYGEPILDENGNVKEYVLGSDISVNLENDIRLFEIE